MANKDKTIEMEKTVSREQSEREAQTVKLVETLFKKSKKAREKWDRDWIENYKFFRGKQWKEKRPSYRHSEVINFTHSAIQTIIPILTDNRPQINTLPVEPSDLEFSDIMTNLLTSKWDRENWAMRVAEAIVDVSIYGTSIGRVPWDEDLLDGLGDFNFEICDPMYFYPDPDAYDINDSRGQYYIYAEPLEVEKVQRLYPKKAPLIRSDISNIVSSQTHKYDLDDVKIRSAVDNRTLVEGERTGDPEASDRVLLITCWIDDKEVLEEKIKVEGKEGKEQTKFRTRRKYPRGRKIVIANNILLEDVENPYADGKAPYAKFIDYIMPREFWGMGEIDQIKGPQVIINKIVSYVLDVLILCGNPIWKVPVTAGVETDNLVNSPGLIVEYNAEGGEPKREEGVQLQPHILSFLDRMQNMFQEISGIHEVTSGAKPTGNSSGYAIDLLQEASQTKLRAKGRNLEMFLNKIGQLMVSRILQYYALPRIIRINNDPNTIKYFQFHIDEKLDEAGIVQSRIAQIMPIETEVDPATGKQIVTKGEIKSIPIKGNLDVKVTLGSSLPFAKQAKASNAVTLFDRGVIDEEELLKTMEWPNAEKILERLKERKIAMAEQAAMEQTQPKQGV